MKIAVSGTHSSGKTTLVEALSAALPGHEVFDEPYYMLEAEGHRFAAPPSIEDLELQLVRSIACITRSARNSIFDRCPLDFLAYLLAHRDTNEADVQAWVSRSRLAIAGLDLIVHVSIEDPDPIPAAQFPRLRKRVADFHCQILDDDPWEFGRRVLRVSGTPRERCRQVLSQLRRETSEPPPT